MDKISMDGSVCVLWHELSTRLGMDFIYFSCDSDIGCVYALLILRILTMFLLKSISAKSYFLFPPGKYFVLLSTLLTVIIVCECEYQGLEDAALKIVGGEAALPGEFAYQVFIEKIWNSTKIFKCGGAIISENFIVTAAHCLFFADLGEFAKPKKIWVTAGTHDLITKDPEIRKFEQISWASDIFPHPQFRYENATSEKHDADPNKVAQQFPIHDIALVRLKTPLNFTDRVKPIRLPGLTFTLQGNGTVTGYGRKEWMGRWTRVLRKVDIPLVEWERCAKVFKGVANVTRDMFCTGTKDGGLSPCNGDSGGPVACFEATDVNRSAPILCGVASFGAKNCANFSIYTRVSRYIEWIERVVAQN